MIETQPLWLHIKRTQLGYLGSRLPPQCLQTVADPMGVYILGLTLENIIVTQDELEAVARDLLSRLIEKQKFTYYRPFMSHLINE